MRPIKRTGLAELPLHGGRAPAWLVKRMTKLADAIIYVLVDGFGTQEFLKRISEPYWFQALGCTLGFDWHSSGVTTVVTGVLKSALKPERHGLAVAGGKGMVSRKTPEEIGKISEGFHLSSEVVERLAHASRLSAKVDNTAIQAGYPLYHHTFFLDGEGRWAVVQQGMNPQDRTARRYHWLSSRVKSFVEEPHSAVVGDRVRSKVLNMTARESEEARKISVDLVREGPRRFHRLLASIRPSYQQLLTQWMEGEGEMEKRILTETLKMPRRINWRAVRRAYEFQPRNYEELLQIRGIGPATVRGLALVSELIYGGRVSWRDPVKFSFAFGGKDGVPFPVHRKAMDRAIDVLETAIEQAPIDGRERLRAIQRLRNLIPRGGREGKI